jgi:UDP:flavonoid glycosyltransferase YjiC (YdhE family)
LLSSKTSSFDGCECDMAESFFYSKPHTLVIAPIAVSAGWQTALLAISRRGMYLQISILLVLVVFVIIEGSATELNNERDFYISFVSVPLLGHVNPLKAVAKEMVSRGYRSSLALPEIGREWIEEVQGLEFISTGPPPEISDELLTGKSKTWSGADIYNGVHHAMLIFAEYQRAMYKQLLEQYTLDPPDMLVIDRFSFAGYDVAHALNLTYVVNNPTLLLDIDEPPSYIPAPYSGFALSNTQTIWERCLNPYYRLRFRLMMIESFRTINGNRAENGLPAISNRWELYGGRLVLTNTAFGLEYSRPMSPLHHMVGPLTPVKPDVLSSSLLAWMSAEPSLTGGIIIVHLGDEHSPLLAWQAEKLVKGLLQAKTNLAAGESGEPAQILCVLPQHQWDLLPSDLPPAARFRLTAKIPHLAVLQHPRVTMTVTTGGFASMQDSLLHGKPVLVVPFSPDQLEVAKLATRLGVGLALDTSSRESFTAESVSRMITTIHVNQTFREAAAKMAVILEEAGGTKRACDLLEASHIVGTRVWLPDSHVQPWYQTQLLDVYTVCSLTICAVAIALRGIWYACCSLFGAPPPIKLKAE